MGCGLGGGWLTMADSRGAKLKPTTFIRFSCHWTTLATHPASNKSYQKGPSVRTSCKHIKLTGRPPSTVVAMYKHQAHRQTTFQCCGLYDMVSMAKSANLIGGCFFSGSLSGVVHVSILFSVGLQAKKLRSLTNCEPPGVGD